MSEINVYHGTQNRDDLFIKTSKTTSEKENQSDYFLIVSDSMRFLVFISDSWFLCLHII